MNADKQVKHRQESKHQSVSKYTKKTSIFSKKFYNKKTPIKNFINPCIDIPRIFNLSDYNAYQREISPIADFNFDDDLDRFSFYKPEECVSVNCDSGGDLSVFGLKVKSVRPLTEPIGFKLSTSRRARDRECWGFEQRQKVIEQEENRK
jgi:hypothetical protein